MGKDVKDSVKGTRKSVEDVREGVDSGKTSVEGAERMQ